MTALGPSLSSILARPAKEYPSLFDGESLVAKKAYLLPSLVPATLGALSLVVAIKWLPEPGHSHANQAQYVSVPVAEDSEDIQNIKNGSLESPEEVSKVLPGEPVFSLTMDMVVTNGLYSSLSFIEVMVDEGKLVMHDSDECARYGNLFKTVSGSTVGNIFRNNWRLGYAAAADWDTNCFWRLSYAWISTLWL